MNSPSSISRSIPRSRWYVGAWVPALGLLKPDRLHLGCFPFTGRNVPDDPLWRYCEAQRAAVQVEAVSRSYVAAAADGVAKSAPLPLPTTEDQPGEPDEGADTSASDHGCR